MNKIKQKILLVSVSGIGNTVMETPTINEILNSNNYIVDILFKQKGSYAVYKFDYRPRRKYLLPKKKLDQIKFLFKLRKEKYDYTVTFFPANKAIYNLFPFIIGAKKRLIHEFKNHNLNTFYFLSNLRIQSFKNLHDVDQNLNLLLPLNIEKPVNPILTFTIAAENKKFASDFIKENKLLNKNICGISIGCNRRYIYRRWPLDYFINLIDRLNRVGISCVLFAGPEEAEETKYIYINVNSTTVNFLILEPDLNNVAALISKCNLFISQDSLLGHIAVSQGANTYAIFGPTNAKRTSPYGLNGNYISLELPCSPCLKYPFGSNNSKIKCVYSGNDQYKCLKELKPEMVLNKISI